MINWNPIARQGSKRLPAGVIKQSRKGRSTAPGTWWKAWKLPCGASGQHRSFEEAILKAANLGDDADTTAAICGQVAGAYYGEGGIPSHWLERLVMREEIKNLAMGLYKNNHPGLQNTQLY